MYIGGGIQISYDEYILGYVDQKGSQDPEFSTGNISVKLIRGQIAKAKVCIW